MILCPHCGERIDVVEPAGLTPAQAQTLQFIRRFIEGNGFSPSYREIRDGIGIRSMANVVSIIAGLEERGHIRRIPDRVRSIQVTSGGPAA